VNEEESHLKSNCAFLAEHFWGGKKRILTFEEFSEIV